MLVVAFLGAVVCEQSVGSCGLKISPHICGTFTTCAKVALSVCKGGGCMRG